MSEQRPEGTIEDMLRDVRQAFEMDVAFVSKFDGDRLVFRKLEGMLSPSGGKKAKASRSTSPTASAFSMGEYRRWSQTQDARTQRRTLG